MVLNSQWITEFKQTNKQKPRYKWKWKPDDPRPIGKSKYSSKREVYNAISLPQVTQKIANNLNLHLKELEGEEQTKPKVSTRQRIIKVRAENKWKETKKTVANWKKKRRKPKSIKLKM